VSNIHIDRLRRMAESGGHMAIPDGPIRDTLGCEACVMLILDSNGSVHQVRGGNIVGGVLCPVNEPRSQVVAMMDQFGTRG